MYMGPYLKWIELHFSYLFQANLARDLALATELATLAATSLM